MKPVPQNQISEPNLPHNCCRRQGGRLILDQSLLEVHKNSPQIIILQTHCKFLCATISDDLEKVNQNLSLLQDIQSASAGKKSRKDALGLLQKMFKLRRIFQAFDEKLHAFQARLKSNARKVTVQTIEEFISEFKDLQIEAGIIQEIRFLLGKRLLRM